MSAFLQTGGAATGAAGEKDGAGEGGEGEGVDGVVLIADWVDRSVVIVDVATRRVTGKVAMPFAPIHIAHAGDRVYLQDRYTMTVHSRAWPLREDDSTAFTFADMDQLCHGLEDGSFLTINYGRKRVARVTPTTTIWARHMHSSPNDIAVLKDVVLVCGENGSVERLLLDTGACVHRAPMRTRCMAIYEDELFAYMGDRYQLTVLGVADGLARRTIALNDHGEKGIVEQILAIHGVLFVDYDGHTVVIDKEHRELAVIPHAGHMAYVPPPSMTFILK